GLIKVEMHFLPDIYVPCDVCKSKRYNRETLEIKYKGKNIHEVLEMTIEEAREFIDAVPALAPKLQTLSDDGLSYVLLGQSATTLSGGEAQRVKLARELSKRDTGKTLYILDEPTTGLHFADIQQLLDVLHRLRDHGNTVVVIEHNLDVIKTADWIVDIGPEAGIDGGLIVAQGTPEEIVARAEALRRAAGVSPLSGAGDQQRHGADAPRSPERAHAPRSPVLRSWTGELLQPVLEHHERGDLELFDAREVAKKRKGDVDIARVGKDAAVPWQVDGRKWHTQDRPARSGRPVQGEGAARGDVMDRLAESEGLQDPNWNDQRTVEITAEKKTGTGWFFHALTGDEWFVRLYFRVPKKTFDADDLQHRLGLTPVDDIDEIPVYGRG